MDTIWRKPLVFERGATALVLSLAVIALILSVSVVEGRIQDLQNKLAILQQYNQQITTLTAVGTNDQLSTALQARLEALQKASGDTQAQIDGADGTIAFGSSKAWAEIRKDHLCNPANYFHGMSSDTNLLLIGLLACMIAYAAGCLHVKSAVTTHDLALSSLSGLIAVLAIKGGRIFVGDPTATGVDVTSPYGIALFSALAGLYTDKFYNFLATFTGNVLINKPQANPPDPPSH